MGLREERTISMEKLRMALTLPDSTAKSPKQAEVTILGLQITSLFSFRIYWFPSRGGHSGRGKAEGKMALSNGRVLASFLFKVSPTSLHPNISPSCVYAPTTCPWLCLLSPHSPRLRSPFLQMPSLPQLYLSFQCLTVPLSLRTGDMNRKGLKKQN